MRAFAYERPDDIDDAIATVSRGNARFLAGGTNLLDLMKGHVENPARLVDINRLSLDLIMELPNGSVRIGALAKNSDTAAHSLIRSRYPLLTQALLAGASPQLRNMASAGGNLMQRTRCHYFYDAAFPACNKRDPGSGCGALEGHNRIHAIFGASRKCVATHPSDMAVALAALDAVVEVRGPTGVRRIPIDGFHRLPGAIPERDTNLAQDELITSVDLPPSPYAGHSHYLKVRDRASYAFALVSVAAALDLDGDSVRGARIVLGGVAHKPWRAERAERILAGRALEPGAIAEAAKAAIEGAEPLSENEFKVELARRSVETALRAAGGVA